MLNRLTDKKIIIASPSTVCPNNCGTDELSSILPVIQSFTISQGVSFKFWPEVETNKCFVFHLSAQAYLQLRLALTTPRKAPLEQRKEFF